MRKPFICIGFEVTAGNMDTLARWCKGNVVREDVPEPFVRVPVSRATNERQTRAYIGTYIVLSVFGKGNSYKVYKKEWLDETFLQLNDSAVAILKALGQIEWEGDPSDVEVDMDEDNETLCCHKPEKHLTSIPTQSISSQPKPGPRPTFQAPTLRTTF